MEAESVAVPLQTGARPNSSRSDGMQRFQKGEARRPPIEGDIYRCVAVDGIGHFYEFRLFQLIVSTTDVVLWCR